MSRDAYTKMFIKILACLVSRPTKTRGVQDKSMSCLNTIFTSMAQTSWSSGAFANSVASPSHELSNISPSGSTSLTPLSCCGLCEAVIISPTAADFRCAERSATSMPIRCMTWSRRSELRKKRYRSFIHTPHRSGSDPLHSLVTDTGRAVLEHSGSRVRVRPDVGLPQDGVLDPLVHVEPVRNNDERQRL